MIEKRHLIAAANTKMPYGRYAGTLLIDLPEHYLLWMARQGFPDSELGRLLSLCLEIKINGLDKILDPLRAYPTVH